MVYIYVLQGMRGKRYVGITKNLKRRLNEHRSGNTKGGQVIGEFQLIHSEELLNYAFAREREKYLKSGAGREWLDKRYPRTGSAYGDDIASGG